MSNLLTNPSFEDGWADLTGSIQEPNEWSFTWSEGKPTYDGWFTQAPELVHKSRRELPSNEHSLYIKDGDWCVKIFASYKAMDTELSQDVVLEDGTYEFVINVYNDTFVWENGKIPPGPNTEALKRASRVGLFIDDQEIWFDEKNVSDWYLCGHELRATFDVEMGSHIVGIKLWNPWPIDNNGYFLDKFSLTRIGDVPKPSGRGKPRVQYDRTYILIPPDYDQEWALAAVNARWDTHRNTIGGSADDAGIGDLDYRTIIAVNPQHWPGDLEKFYDEHYPGVEYVPVLADTPSELYVKLEG